MRRSFNLSLAPYWGGEILLDSGQVSRGLAITPTKLPLQSNYRLNCLHYRTITHLPTYLPYLLTIPSFTYQPSYLIYWLSNDLLIGFATNLRSDLPINSLGSLPINLRTERKEKLPTLGSVPNYKICYQMLGPLGSFKNLEICYQMLGPLGSFKNFETCYQMETCYQIIRLEPL